MDVTTQLISAFRFQLSAFFFLYNPDNSYQAIKDHRISPETRIFPEKIKLHHSLHDSFLKR